MRTTCSNKLLWILHFFVKSSKNWYVVPHKTHWYARKDFLKKYSKTRKLEHFEDKRSQKSAKNQFFAKHQSKKWYFWKRISQGGPIYLGTFRVWQAKNSMKYEPSYPGSTFCTLNHSSHLNIICIEIKVREKVI